MKKKKTWDLNWTQRHSFPKQSVSKLWTPVKAVDSLWMFKANPNRSFSSLGEFRHWSYGCSMAFTGSSIIKSHNKFALVSLSKILVQQGCFWVPNVKITVRFWRKPQTYLSNLSIWKIYFIWSLWLINYWHLVAPSIWQQLDETFLLTYTDVTSFKASAHTDL